MKKNDEIKDMDSTIQTQTQDISQKAQLIAKNQKQIESQEKEIYEKQQVLDQKKQQVANVMVSVWLAHIKSHLILT